jgi:hypothetical protein
MSGEVLARSPAMTAQFQGFWQSDIQMILQTGHVAAVLSGFEQYWEAKAAEKFRRPAGSLAGPAGLFFLRGPESIENRHGRPGTTIRAWKHFLGAGRKRVL